MHKNPYLSSVYCCSIFFILLLLSYSGNASVTLSPEPSHASYCSGNDGVKLIASDLEPDTDYHLYVEDGGGWELTAGPFSVSPGESQKEIGVFPTGNYKVIWIDEFGEELESNEVSITRVALPEVHLLTERTGDDCVPVRPVLSGSQIGVRYTLYRGTTEYGFLSGDGQELDFGIVDEHGKYTISAAWENEQVACPVMMDGEIDARRKPEEVMISPAHANLCAGRSVVITFHDTEPNTTYYIMSPEGQEEYSFNSGDGGSYNFSHTFTKPGIYSIEAINAFCSTLFEREITIGITPEKFTMLSPVGCPGTEIALDGCEENVDYKLPPPLPLPGVKASDISEDEDKGYEMGSCTDGTLSFGPKYQSGIYRIEAIHRDSGCSVWMHGETAIMPEPRIFAVTPEVAEACIENTTIGLNHSEPGVNYTLIKDRDVEIETVSADPDGGPVSFSALDEPGVYSVIARFGSDNDCETFMDGEIRMYRTPESFKITANGEVPDHSYFCSESTTIGLSNSQQGVEYRLRKDGNVVATHSPDGGAFEFAGITPEQGVYTITAHRAGCHSAMEGSIRISDGPAEYSLTTSKSVICESSNENIILSLSGSQPSANYQLLLNGSPVGAELSGTGNVLRWENIEQPGVYEVVAVYKGDESCPVYTESVEITHVPDPVISSFSLSNGSIVEICNTECIELTITYSAEQEVEVTYTDGHSQSQIILPPANNENHTWEVCPPQNASYRIQRARYTGEPYCQVEINDLDAIDISVRPGPVKFVFEGTPEYPHGSNCAPVNLRLQNSQENVSYSLFRDGEILAADITGDGNPIDFGQYDIGGTYYVIANKNGCEEKMTGEITINALPDNYSVAPQGVVCSHKNSVIGLDGGPQPGVQYTLWRNGSPYSDMSIIDGDLASEVSFTDLNQTGTYRIHAENKTTGCQRLMPGSLQINKSPEKFTLYPSETSCGPAQLYLNGSEEGVDYILYRQIDDEELYVETVTGQGDPVYFQKQERAGNYFVVAKNDYCERIMHGEAKVGANPLVFDITPSAGNYCVESSLQLGLEGSEPGKTYGLYHYNSLIDEQAGTGGSISFNQLINEAGPYSVKATDNSTGCTSWMDGEVRVNQNPYQFNLQASQTTSEICLPVELGLDNSQKNATYYLVTPDGREIEATGTGRELSFGKVFLPGNYTAYGVHNLTTCTVDMHGSIEVVVGPDYKELLIEDDNPFYCPGDLTGNRLYFEDTESGMLYELYRDDEVVDSQEGHGGIVEWLDVAEEFGPGVYYVKAISESPACNVKMKNSYEIREAITPTVGFEERDTIRACETLPVDILLEFEGDLPLEVDYEIFGERDTLIIDTEKYSGTFNLADLEIRHSASIVLKGVRYAVPPYCEGEITNDRLEIEVTGGPFSLLPPHLDLCGLDPVTLSPNAGGYSSFSWELLHGHGELMDKMSITPTYMPSDFDINDTVRVALTLRGEGVCGDYQTVYYSDMVFHLIPVVDAGPDYVILAGDTVMLEEPNIDYFSTFDWVSPEQRYSGSFTHMYSPSPVYQSSMDDAGKTIPVMLRAWGIDKCQDQYWTDMLDIKVGSAIHADLEAINNKMDSVLCMNSRSYFKDISHYGDYDPHPDQTIAYRKWDFGDGTIYESTDPQEFIVNHVYDYHGSYEVTLEVGSALNGTIITTDTISYTVDILDCDSNRLFFPNALAPDHSDPEVRIFKPKGINIKDFELKIYDQWGDLLWQTNEVDSFTGMPTEGWDGNLKDGSPAPQGIYIYSAKARFNNGAIMEDAGTITLIR